MLCYFRMWLLLDFILEHKHLARTLDTRAIVQGLRKNFKNISRSNHVALSALNAGNESTGERGEGGEAVEPIPSSSERKDQRGRRNAADFILQWRLDSNTTVSLYAYKYQFQRQNCCFNSTRHYDSKGAMYFAIAVILFYGISIAMLVAASTLKRSRTDYELKGFLRSYARIEEEKRTREKQLVRTVLQQRNLLHLWPGGSSAHRPSFLARMAQLEALRRASRTSACSNATSKKSSIDRTSLLVAITEERRRASFPEKRATSSDPTEAAPDDRRGLFKTRSCAEVVAAGLEKMTAAAAGVVVVENGELGGGATTRSAPVGSNPGESPTASAPKQQKLKLHSFRSKSNLDSSMHRSLAESQTAFINPRSKNKRNPPRPPRVPPSVLPVVTVELFEDAKESTGFRKVEVQDDLVVQGSSIKTSHRRSSEVCLKNFLGS